MEKKPTYQELEESVIELELLVKKESRERERIGNTVHELNNILMGIQGTISLIIHDMDDGNPFYEKLSNVENFVQKAAGLTGSIHDLLKKNSRSVQMEAALKEPPARSSNDFNFAPLRRPGIHLYNEMETSIQRVLLVDDEKIIIDVGKQMLEKIGLEVMVAESGFEAEEIYKRKFKKINIVILDMVMPGIDGIETYNRLKAINPYLRVLFSSGYRKNNRIDTIMEEGVNGFIQKPFNMNNLSQAVKRILNIR